MRRIWVFAAVICAVLMAGAAPSSVAALGSLKGLFVAEASLDDIPELRKLAAKEDAEAQYLLYVAYRQFPRDGAGPGVATEQLISRSEAEAGLRAAAEQGHDKAVAQLGLALLQGQSVRRDARGAVPWLEAAYARTTDQKPGAAYLLGDALLLAKDRTDEERQRGLELIEEALAGGIEIAVRPRARQMQRSGDAVGARALLEAAVSADNPAANAPLARMLIDGTGGEADVARGLDLLRQAEQAGDTLAAAELGREHLKGGHLLRKPRVAIGLLARHGEKEFGVRQAIAQLLVVFRASPKNAAGLFFRLKEDEQVGEPEAAWNLLQLLDRKRDHFRDDGYVFDLVGRHKASDVRIEVWNAKINARFARLSDTPEVLTKQVKVTLGRMIEQQVPQALTLKGHLLRAGHIYPRDDRVASLTFLEAAKLGDVEAIVQVAKAYDEGLGAPKDRAKYIAWLREAVAHGSVEAKLDLIWEYKFGPPVTVREGVTEAIAAYGNEVGPIVIPMTLGGLFSRARIGGPSDAELVSAFMDGFRAGPAAAEGNKILALQRAVPQRVWAQVEAALVAEGLFDGPAEGHFGPDARTALMDWVLAKGPLP